MANTITGGTLQLGGTGTSSGLFLTNAITTAQAVSSAITLNAASTIQNAGTGVLTISGGITGAQNLTLNNNGATASGITISTGSLNNTGTVTNSGTGSILISSVIGTNVTGVVQSSGTLTLSGANTFTGPTTVTGGTLSFNTIGNVGAVSSALGAPTTAGNGTINLTGTLLYTGAATSTDRIINLTGAGTVNSSSAGLLTLTGGVTGTGLGGVTFRGTGSITQTGIIGSGVTTVGKTEAGTLTLTNAANAFTGQLQISNGIVSVNSISDSGLNSAIGAGSGIRIGQNGFNNTGTLQFTGASGGSTNRTIFIQSNSATTGGVIENTQAGQLLTLTGTVDTTGLNAVGGLLTLTGAGNGQINGALANGPGNLILTKAGLGTWTLNGANTYSGMTTVNAGTLRLGASGSLASGALLTTGGGTFDINGRATTLGAVTATTGTITNSGAAQTLVFGGATASTGAANWSGAMNVTLNNGAANSSLTGAWSNTGNIVLNANGAGTITLGTGAVNPVGTITNSGSGTGTTTISSVIGTNVTGVIQDSATSQLTLQGANTWTTGGLTIKKGTVLINTAASVNALGAGTVTIGDSANTGAAATLLFNGSGAFPAFSNPITVTGNGSGASTPTLSVTAWNPAFSGAVTLGNNLNVVSNNTAGSTIGISGGITGTGNLVIQSNAASGTANSQITFSGTTLNFTGSITNSGTTTGTNANTTISAVIGTNVTGVTQNSANSQLTLSNAANTFTSAVTISQGQLNASSVTGFGAITATTNLNLGSAGAAGTLNYTGGASSSTRPVVVGGAGGGVINSTTGLLTLTGTVSLASGPLTIGGSNNVTIGSATAAVAQVLGTNTLTKTGAGTLTLSTLTAIAPIQTAMPIALQAGTLTLQTSTTGTTNNPLGTGALTITPGATLNFNSSGHIWNLGNAITIANTTATANISGTGNLNVGTSAANTIAFAAGANTPILSFSNPSTGSPFLTQVSSTISGTGNVELNGTAAGFITVSGPQNQTGTIRNVGTSTNVATLSGAIGSGITAISQAGASPFTVSSSVPLSATLNSFTSTGAGLWTFSNNTNTFTGSQNLTFNANSTGGITVSGTNLNHTGTVTNSGTSTGTTTISSALGANVGNVIQNSATSALVLSGTNSAYTGTYTVSNGLMQFSNTGAMAGFTGTPNADVKLSVGNGGILALPYPAFTATNVTDLVNNANGGTYSNVTFATGASIGLDTTAGSTSFASVLANPTGSALGLVKLGTNTLTLGNANTYTGRTWIQNGTLSVESLNSVTTPTQGASSSLGVPDSAANGTLALGNLTTTGVLSYTGAGETTDRVINLAGTSGGGGIDNSGAGTLIFSSPMTFTGTGAKTLTLSGASNIVFGSTLGTNGVGTPAALVIAKNGANTVTLNGATSTITTLNIAGGVIDIGANGLSISNTGNSVIAATGNATINATGGGFLTLSSASATDGGNFGAASGFTLTVNANIQTSGTGGTLELFNAANSTGVVVLNGTNTYTGTTIINSGVLSVSNIGNQGSITSNLGSGTTINIGNGTSTLNTLRYTGIGETTNRIVNLSASTGGAIIEQSGTSGLLKFTTAFTASTAGIKVLTLQGSTAGTGEIGGAIVNSTATTGVTKAGTGTWTLSGVNTYTGATTVNGGNLILGPTGSLSNTGIVINSGGTLSPRAGFTVGNTLTAAAGGALTLNSGGTLNLADGTIGTLNLVQNSTFAGNAATFAGGSIIFDISASAADMIDVRLGNVAGTGLATSSGINSISFNPIAGSLGVGTYTLINAAGTLNNSNFFLASPNLVVGGTLYNLSLGLVGTNEVLTVATGGAAVAPNFAYWKGTTDASWSLGSAGGVPTNWVAASNGTIDTFAVPASTSNVILTADTVGTGGLVTTLDQAFTINSLAFSGTGTANTTGSTIASGTGSNTLTINAAALNGNTLGNGITVLAGSGANTISADVVLGGSQTWTNNSTNPLAITGNITGTGLTLTTAGTGAIQIGNGGATGSIANDVAIVTNGNLAFNRSNNLTVSNAISGSGSVTKLGSGTLILSGSNAYNGATIVNDGTLKAGSTSALGVGSALTVTSTGTLDLGGFNNTIGSLAASTGTITDSSSPGSGGILQITGTTATAIAATVTGSVGFQYHNNLGNNALFSNAANTYSGGTYLGIGTNRARYSPAASATIGNGVGMGLTAGIFGTGTIHLGRAITDHGQIFLQNASGTINNPITYNSILGTDVVGGVRMQGSGSGWTFAGVQTAGLSAISYGAHFSASTLIVTGQLTGSGTFSGTISNLGGNLGGGNVIGTNAGLIIGASNNNIATVALNNAAANNNYTGDTYVTAQGVLRTDAANQLPSGAGTGNLYVNGGTFNMQGNSQATGLLSGAGTIDGISGTPTLNIGGNNATGLTFSGIIRNTAGTLSLTKIGSGTQTLSGANTFSGNTLVSAGTIALGNALALQNSAYDTASAAGGLDATGFTTPTLGGLTGSGNLSPTLITAYGSITNLTLKPLTGVTNTHSGVIPDGAAGMILTKSGAGTQILSGLNTYTGSTAITAGTLKLGASGDATNTPLGTTAVGTTVSGTGTLDLNGNTLGTAEALSIAASGTSNSGALANTGAAASFSGLVSLGAAARIVATGDIALTNTGTITGATFGLTLDGTSTNSSIAGIIGTTSGSLTKTGTGTWILSGISATAATNYTGTTTIDQGTLGITHATTAALTGGLTFGSAGTNTTAGILDLTNASATFAGALTVNTNSATANEIKIGAAQTLTINNNVQIGATTPVTGLNAVTKLNLTGGGVFNVNTAAAGTFIIGGSTLTSTSTSQDSTLDLTALTATTINTSTTGTIRVSAGSSSNVAGYKSTLLLPTPVVADTVATATLTAGTIGVGAGAGFNSTAGQINTLQLGTGLTALNADNINVGTGGRDIGQIIFAGAGGDVRIRAADGTSRATAFNVGAGGGGTGTTNPTVNNLVDFSGHDANILVTSLNVGNQPRVGNLISEFKFGAGDASLTSVLDTTNVNIGFRTGTATATSVLTNRVILSGGTVTFGNAGATGTGVDIGNSTYNQAGAASTIGELNISGGNVTIHNGTGGFAVRLGTNAAAGGGTVTASLNLTGGTTTLGGDIVRGTTSPRTTSTLTLNGASAILDMGGNDIGTLAAPITLTAASGTLQNVGTINGTGGLTKTTSGTLTLAGMNTYTGDTNVDAGILRVNGSHTGGGAYTVASAGTLQGTGSTASVLNVSGVLSPGASIETFASGTLNMLANSTFDYEVDSSVALGIGADLQIVTGDFNLTGLVNLSIGDAAVTDTAFALGTTFSLINYTGAWNNNLFTVGGNAIANAGTFTVGLNTWQLDYNSPTGGSNFSGEYAGGSDSFVNLTVIPEPSSVALLGVLGSMLLLRRRR